MQATLRAVSRIKLWKCMYFPFDGVTCSYDGTTKTVRGMKRLVFFPFFSASRYVSASFNPLERIKHQKTVLPKENTLTKLKLTLQSRLYDNEAKYSWRVSLHLSLPFLLDLADCPANKLHLITSSSLW